MEQQPQTSQITQKKKNLERDPQTFAIIGAAMEVHRALGPGFLEAAYQEAMALEFDSCDVTYQSQPLIPVRYKGHLLECGCRADFVCFDSIIVELKTVDALGRHDAAQLLNYLKATGLSKGLLFNFKASQLGFKRFVFDSSVKSAESVVNKNAYA